MSTPETPASTASDRSVLLFVLPALIFAALAVVFFAALRGGDPSVLPSALIDKPAPAFSLPPVAGIAKDGKTIPGFASADLASGEVTVVTVWASWCMSCAQEQPTLMSFKARHNIRVYGINYKDTPEAARVFLARYGNPFDAIGEDRSGRVGIDWGVYGAPETFVVDGRGTIVYKYVGPLNEMALRSELLPAIEKARNKS